MRFALLLIYGSAAYRRRRRRSVREGGPVFERNAVIIQRWRDTLAWPRAYPPCWSRLTVINMRLEVCKRIVPWLAADRWSGKKIPIWWTGALTSSSFSPPSLYHAFPPCCSSSLRFLHFFSSSPFPSPSLFNPIEVFYFFLFLGAKASIQEFLGEELRYGWLCNLGACVILFVIDGRDDCYTTSVWVWSEGALVLQIGSKGIIFLFREVVTLIL